MNHDFSFSVEENVPLAKHTSWRIGGPAKYFAYPESVTDLEELAGHLRSSGEAFAFLGNGSNLLVPDEGFDGWIIKTSKFNEGFSFSEDNKATVSAGTLNSKFVRACANEGLGGAGFLGGFPGTIGGAVVMNAGIGSACVNDIIDSIRTFCFARGEQTYDRSQIKLTYRQQHFMKETELVTEAVFQLKSESSELLKQEIADSAKYRKEAQPIDRPSCGSVFRNPDSGPAWKYIDAAGLKGIEVGDAIVSEKHANWIINRGGAKMTDVLNLIELIKEKVKETSGIELEEEVKLLKPVRLPA